MHNPPSTDTLAIDPLAQSLRLPCGAILRNRLAKAAMTEGMADPQLRASTRLERLYRAWSHGGAGLHITGNVMIDRRVIERPGNVAIDASWPVSTSAEARAALKRWAAAGTEGGNHLWMQISHAGRQSPWYVTRQPLAPSAVRLDLLGNYALPRALSEQEIRNFIGRFAFAARVARDSGFTGVQIHAAHGYLVSSFLSPHTNRRDDGWGGTLAQRARFLLEIVRATRLAVGADFPIGVKLNSDDFRKGGFSHDDALAVVQLLNAEGIDLLEISGGTYEQPQLLGVAGRARDAVAVRPSTLQREAYFLAYAEAIRPHARMPLMVTGGFRTRAAMEGALADGSTDVIGIARPLCTDPDAIAQLLARRIERLPSHETHLHLRPNGWLSPASPLLLAKLVNVLGAQGWYYQQMDRIGDGHPVDTQRGLLRAFARYYFDEFSRALRMRRDV